MPLRIRWEGDISSNHSLSIVNREITRRLAATPDFEVTAQEETHTRTTVPADLCVRHHWPPNLCAPRGERWVMMQPWEYGSVPRLWFDALAFDADEVWVYSSFNKQCYVDAGVPEEKIHVVPLGVQATMLDGPEPFPLRTRKQFRFLFVGGTIQRKGIDVLLAAYRKAFSGRDDVCLVVKDFGVGSYYRNQTAERFIRDIQHDPAAPEIEYIADEIAPEQLRDLYHACDCLVHPYRGEGFGLPIAEAMACGLPVIVTERGGASDFCTPETALLIPATSKPVPLSFARNLETVQSPWWMEPDARALAERMREVFEAPGTVQRIADQGRRLIRARFTWDDTVRIATERIRHVCRTPVPLSGDPVRREALLTGVGDRFWEAGQADAALRCFARAAEIERSPDNLYNLSAALLSRGHTRTALPLLDRIVDLLADDPTNEAALFRAEVAGIRAECRAALAVPANQPKELRWHASLHNASGYADESRNFLFGILEQCPYDVHVEAIDAHMGQGVLTDSEFHSLKTLAAKPAAHADIDFQHITPEDFQYPRAPISIARTMFETDGIPPGWAERCNLFTEIWVPTEFNRETFARSGVVREKIRIVPGCIDLSKYDRTALPRMRLKDAPGFRFLSIFDFQPRKGWDVLLDAYLTEFSLRDDVTLVLKVTGFHARQITPAEEIRRFIAKRGYRDLPRFIVIDGKLPERELLSLYASCDAFVLPSRGEGWGRPYMEAMALGLPTIATRWSAHLAFMNDRNSFLVDVEGLEPCERTWDNPLYRGQQWAVPSISSLRARMRFVVDDRDQARHRGEQAARDIAERFDRPVVAKQFLDTLATACGQKSPRTPVLHHDLVPEPVNA